MNSEMYDFWATTKILFNLNRILSIGRIYHDGRVAGTYRLPRPRRSPSSDFSIYLISLSMAPLFLVQKLDLHGAQLGMQYGTNRDSEFSFRYLQFTSITTTCIMVQARFME